jgi:hypothetical protein
MMKSINRLLFVRRWQGQNLLLLRTQRPICPKWTAQSQINCQKFSQPRNKYF